MSNDVHQSVTLQNRCLASPDCCFAIYLIDNHYCLLYVIGAAPKTGQDFKPAGGTIQSKNYPDDYPNRDRQVIKFALLWGEAQLCLPYVCL